ncbi:MAG: TetR family transcriptional regulator [Acidobacteria bacterium]|nr:TetR family transcriptional regulator [Acidobacteriota bacterium]
MPRGRAAKFPQQQQAILQQAARLFASRGFPGTSMHELAAATGVSKALLYHYYEDKYRLLVAIAEGHIDRLTALVDDVDASALAPDARLRRLIERFVQEYADAQAHHQVLVQDIKYLHAADEGRVRDKERRVVACFARAVAAVHPGLAAARLEKPLTMLLFGMINWMFTWFRDDGTLGYADMSRLVTEFVVGGLGHIATGPLHVTGGRCAEAVTRGLVTENTEARRDCFGSPGASK